MNLTKTPTGILSRITKSVGRTSLSTSISFVTIILVATALYLIWRSDTAPGHSQIVTLELRDAVPPSEKTAGELIAFWQARYERDPRDYISVTYLADAYLQQARETGAADSYARAEAALDQALMHNPDYSPALSYRATVHFANHEFAEALSVAERVYSVDNGALHALATIGDANLELGNYAEARQAYTLLQTVSASPPVYSRLANYAWLTGDMDEAFDHAALALENAIELGLKAEALAWYYVQLGTMYWRTGDLAGAERQFSLAIDIAPRYFLAEAGLGHVAAARGDVDVAITLFEDIVTRLPQPEFIATLGDLYALQGREDAAQQQYETVTAIADLSELNGTQFDRQLVLFLADQNLTPGRALALAQAELTNRQDIYSHDAYAWALYAAGRFSEAEDAINQALTLGTLDARLHYHAGMIAYANGDLDNAVYYLERALSINPYFDLLQARMAAETLANLKENR